MKPPGPHGTVTGRLGCLPVPPRARTQWENSSGAQISRNRVAQTVKSLPAKQNTRVQSLGREDLLQKEMATHSSTLAWKILCMEEPGRLQSMGSQRVRDD